MTLFIAILVLAMLAWIVERLDRLHEDIEELIATVEQGGEAERRVSRSASRRS